jgi:hypothetical protein
VASSRLIYYGVDQNFGLMSGRVRTKRAYVIESWGVKFAGDRGSELGMFDYLTEIRENKG